MENLNLMSAGLLGLALAATGATAQEAPGDWPSRNVSVVVGAGPGGTNDTVARLVAEKLSERLGVQFIVENMPGAGTSIASSHVARATADGYTLLSNSASLTTAPLQFQVDYDTRTDLTPISQFVDAPFVIVVHASLGISTLQEYADYARAHPGELNWGTLGGLQGVGGRWLDHVLGIETQSVPYRDANQMYTDLIVGDQLNASMVQSIAMAQHIAAGSVVPLAWTSLERNPALPDVPSMGELGYPEFQMSLWQGVFGPGGMDPALAERISAEVASIAADPDVIERMAAFGFTMIGSTPAEFAEVVNTNLDSWERLVSELGLTLQ